MPKQIKKETLTRAEKANRVIAVIAMIFTVLFAAALAVFLRDLMNDTNLWGAYVIFAAYAVFFGLSLAHCLQGLYVYKKQDHFGVLFQSIISGAAAFTALVNLQFAIVMLLSAMGKGGAAQKVIGSRTMDDFVVSQRTSWMLLMCGMAAMIFVGISGAARLASTGKSGK